MSSRANEISSLITKAIMDHRLVPGAKIGERELGEILGASRVVVRQALIRVADDGLVTLERNRGAFVARPSLQDLLDIYDAMTLIEQGVAANLSSRVNSVGWAEIKRHVNHQRQATLDRNHPLCDHLGAEFHSLLVRLNRNPVLVEVHNQLTRRITLIRSLYRGDYDYDSLNDDHEKILRLIEEKQVKRVQKLISEHNRLVVRGYIIAEQEVTQLPLPDALMPYLATASSSMPDGAAAVQSGGSTI
jgi:DNA-binding GntR family transcriptional regulator